MSTVEDSPLPTLEGDVTAVTSPLNLVRPPSASHGRPGDVSSGHIRAIDGRLATAGQDCRVMAML